MKKKKKKKVAQALFEMEVKGGGAFKVGASKVLGLGEYRRVPKHPSLDDLDNNKKANEDD